MNVEGVTQIIKVLLIQEMSASVLTTVYGIDINRVKRYDEKQRAQRQLHFWATLLLILRVIFQYLGDYFKIREYAFYQSYINSSYQILYVWWY